MEYSQPQMIAYSTIRAWAQTIKRDVVALWIAARDNRTPWHVRCLSIFVAAYALSPIDLIPDFVPALGYLDDLVFVPLGIWLAVQLIPTNLMDEFRRAAIDHGALPGSKVAGAIIVVIWILLAAMFIWFGFQKFTDI